MTHNLLMVTFNVMLIVAAGAVGWFLGNSIREVFFDKGEK